MKVWVRPLRYHFRAVDPILWTKSGPANVLRGALGMRLRERSGCDPRCSGPACARPDAAVCAYGRIFAPRGTNVPSGFADMPRPFVIRPGFLEERTEPGGEFQFDLHVFDRDREIAQTIGDCLTELSERGLGPSRGRAVLERVEVLALDGGVAERHGPLPDWEQMGPPGVLSTEAVEHAPSRLRVRFATPTELRADGRVSREAPDFAVLVARVRDRFSGLALGYGEPAEGFDYKGLVERAGAVHTVESRVEYHNAGRFSTRSRRYETLGGFTGCAVYEGPVGEALGLLRSAYWTGVGRQTVWGHGALMVEPA